MNDGRMITAVQQINRIPEVAAEINHLHAQIESFDVILDELRLHFITGQEGDASATTHFAILGSEGQDGLIGNDVGVEIHPGIGNGNLFPGLYSSSISFTYAPSL